MRMRRKKHLDTRMAACADYLVAEPEQYKGIWREVFALCKARRPHHAENLPDPMPRDDVGIVPYELYLEIGCGKGKFIREKSRVDGNAYFLAMEKVTNVIVAAMETAKAEDIQNVKFLNEDAENLTDYFADGELDGIYLNFSDPWRKRDQYHRRLTYKTFLDAYRRILKPGAFVEFKTDNRDLFDFSVKSFRDNGYEIVRLRYDLHNSEFAPGNIMTEYEINFSGKGFTINYLRVVPVPPM